MSLNTLVYYIFNSICLFSLLILLICLILRRISIKRLNNYETTRNILVLVIGDIGRSPRMQNHASCISKNFCNFIDSNSFSKKLSKNSDKIQYRNNIDNSNTIDTKINNNHVYLVGYNETECNSSVTNDKNITISGITKPKIDKYRDILPLCLFLPIKVAEQSLRIFLKLLFIPNLSGIILQVPPSIPVIPIAIIISFIRKAPLIIDWHNYGHTLLIKHKNNSIIIEIYWKILIYCYKLLEFSLGKYSSSSFCVSKAMQKDLIYKGIKSTVIYDRPNSEFKPNNSISSRHSILFKYFSDIKDDIINNNSLDFNSKKYYDRFTNNNNNNNKLDIFYTDIKDISLNDTKLSVLSRIETNRSIFKYSKTNITAKSPYVKESFIEEEFFFEMETNIFDELSISNLGFDMSELSTRDDIFFDNFVFENTPISNLGISCEQVDNNLSFKVKIKKDRPAILITSTSWTPDEDLDLLLEALILYNDIVSKQRKQKHNMKILPDIFLIITGKGPNKLNWLNKASKTNMKYIKIRTVFVQPDDYPKLLASSDLGISLHYSSSGLDLPMKVVDMLGAGIPVISFNYPTINELLKNDQVNLFFNNSQQLCERLVDILEGFGTRFEKEFYPSQKLNKIIKYNRSRKQLTFLQEWSNKAIHHFNDIVI